MRSLTCDVLVAGSGIGGMSAAVSAARSGAEVVVVDGNRYVDESSRYTVIGWATGSQREGVGFCIFDHAVYADFAETIDVARGMGVPG